jgi:hypothetical protein
MYNDFKFAEDSKVEVFKDINEALKRSFDIKVNPISATVEDIEVTKEGHILFQGEEKQISSRGIESFFKVLGIPPIFSRKIPTDLLLNNVTQLTKDIPAEPITVLERPDGNIASIVGGDYSEIPYSDILGRFTERPVKSVEMCESLLKVIFTFESLKVPDLDDDKDTFYVGEFLTASLTKLISLQATAGLYRTQCENSFIMNLLGRLKANYMKKEDVRLARFADSFECYNNDVIATVFRNFVEKKQKYLKEYQLKKVWENMSRIFSKSDADLLFGFDEDSRNIVLNDAKTFLMEYKKAEKLGLELPIPSDTAFSAFKVANDITTKAHTQAYDVIDQLKAEVLGGNILQWMVFLN